MQLGKYFAEHRTGADPEDRKFKEFVQVLGAWL